MGQVDTLSQHAPAKMCRPAPLSPFPVLDCIILKHNDSLQFSLTQMIATSRYYSWVASYHMQLEPNLKHQDFYITMENYLLRWKRENT
jgi:hypothetical protein